MALYCEGSRGQALRLPFALNEADKVTHDAEIAAAVTLRFTLARESDTPVRLRGKIDNLDLGLISIHNASNLASRPHQL